MSPMSRERIEQLEGDLRTARSSFDDVHVSPDAWQQNQRRLVVAPSPRGRVLGIAAVLVAVILAGAVVASLTDDGPRRGAPASSGEDAFSDAAVLGPPVELGRRMVDGETVVHEAVLSDLTGDGPMLCDREMAVSSGSEGCADRDPEADDPAVAVDWLTGSQVDGAHSLVGGVDGRVLKVQVWMDNGDMTLADLKPGGWEGTQLFGVSVPADGPAPQRLVAYADASGDVLQSVDLVDRFGVDWLPGVDGGCRDLQPATTVRFSDGTTVHASSVDAEVTFRGPGGGTRSVCRTMTGTPVALVRAGDALVVVASPEVADVRLDDDGRAGGSTAWRRIGSTMWRATVLPAQELRSDDVLEFLDASGAVLQILPVKWII